MNDLLPLLVGLALVLAALLAYVRWQRSGDLLALLTSAFASGLAGLARAELFAVGGALTLVVALAPLPAVRRAKAKREQHAAFAIAYAAAVFGVLGLWLILAFAIPRDVWVVTTSPSLSGK
jgi:hypothetical protein